MKIEYLTSVKTQFEYYKSYTEKTFDQLDEKDFFWQYNDESNSIGIIVNHLWENMKSRSTDFLTSDGEKDWRNRDMEFETVIKSKNEMIEKWNDGWKCLFNALESINEENFETKVYLKSKEITIIEAINKQLSHYSYHIGQIVYIGRMIKGKDWQNLSIPKVKSSKLKK